MSAITLITSADRRFLKTKAANPPTARTRAGQTRGVRSICNPAKNPRVIKVKPLVILIQRSPGRVLRMHNETPCAMSSPSGGIVGKIYPGNFDLERLKKTIGNIAQQPKNRPGEPNQ